MADYVPDVFVDYVSSWTAAKANKVQQRFVDIDQGVLSATYALVAEPVAAAETTRATAAEALKLAKASNLSDLASNATARANLYLEVNVKSYGALGDGATDDSTAIQNAINAVATAGSGVVRIPRGSYVVNTSLTFPVNKQVALRGEGMPGAGYTAGTILKRTSGTNPVISAVGTSSSNRVVIELRDLGCDGGGLSGDVVLIQRGSHILIENVRVANGAATGLHCTELWDSSFHRLIVEVCGNGTTSPATLFDSVVGGGANANCATIHITNSIWQGNVGTDIKLTGSIADSSPANEIQFVNVKMESGTGTQPFIDLDYAQTCSFVNAKILVPSGRNPNAAVQQINTSATSIGSRANTFVNCDFDLVGTTQYWIDVAVGTVQSMGCTFIGTPAVNDIRIQSTTIAGRVRVFGPTPHGILDSRTYDEKLSANLGSGALVGSDISIVRSATNQLRVEGSSSNGASMIISGSDSGTTDALALVSQSALTTNNVFMKVNGRSRFGWDGTLQGVCIDDGNSGANKVIYVRNNGALHSQFDLDGTLRLMKVGGGLRVKEGTNAKQGTATLSAGTVVVSNTSVTASSRIILTGQDNNVTGALRVSARTAGTSFTITSSAAGDTGVVAYQIFEPA